MNRFQFQLTLFILLLLSGELFSQQEAGMIIPRDTSFTPYQAWIKIQKDFPNAILVKPQLPAGVRAEKDVVYASLHNTPFGRRELHLDLFRPEKSGKYPVLLLIHGGGWRSGNKSMDFPLAQQIAAKGYVTAAIEHRLSPEALYPAAVYDIKAAIRFLRANAKKYQIDPDKIAVAGSSAGGQLAALVGSTAGVEKFEGEEGNPGVSSAVQAIVDIDGVLDFNTPDEKGKNEEAAKKSAGALWFGATFNQNQEKWIEASPIQYVGKNTPPMLFINSALPRFHFGRDSVISILNKNRIYSEVHTIENTPHPFWLFHPWFEPTVKYMVGFLDKVLKPTSCPVLSVSPNHRYLLAGKQPFFWLGDTGWLMLSKLNKTEIEKYLQNRKEKGFNVVQVMVLHNLAAVNCKGDSALINRNVATPRLTNTEDQSGYWDNLDFTVDLAAEKGIYLALVPVWGTNVKAGLVTSKQAETYAEFLAKRYRNKPNIVWLNGGDVRGSDSIKVWQTIGRTLKKYDPNHLISYHPFGRTQSSTWFHQEDWLDFNMFQSGHRRYDQDTARNETRYGEDNWRYLLADYAKKPIKPSLDGEPSYEGIPQGLHDTLQPKWTAGDVRRYAYWSVFSGGCGFTYGNNSVMQFYKPDGIPGAYGARESWETALNSPGASQLTHLKNLMDRYRFYELVPDPSLVADQGERYNYQPVLKGKNVLLIYTYNGRPIKLKPDFLKNSNYKYSWYSPRSGEMLPDLKPINSEGNLFTPQGGMKDGNDWVLILEKISN